MPTSSGGETETEALRTVRSSTLKGALSGLAAGARGAVDISVGAAKGATRLGVGAAKGATKLSVGAAKGATKLGVDAAKATVHLGVGVAAESAKLTQAAVKGAAHSMPQKRGGKGRTLSRSTTERRFIDAHGKDVHPLKEPLLQPSPQPSPSPSRRHAQHHTRAAGHHLGNSAAGAGGGGAAVLAAAINTSPVGVFGRVMQSTHSPKLARAVALSAYYGLGAAVYGHLEGWSFSDSIYFTTASVTTVGYGDFVPTSHASMLFSIFYLGVGLVLVGSLINGFGQSILARAEDTMLDKLDDDPTDDVPPDDRWQLVIAAVALLAFVLLGTLFFAVAQGCGLGVLHDSATCWPDPWSSALYFSFVTMSSCGYGDRLVTTTGAKWFAVFFILAGSVVFGYSINKVADVHFARRAEAKKKAFLAMELDIHAILTMDRPAGGGMKRDSGSDEDVPAGDGKVDKGEFLMFGLQTVGALEENDPHAMRIMAAFDKYDVSGDGKLDEEDLQLLMEDMESTRKEHAENEEAKEVGREMRRANRSIFDDAVSSLSSALGSPRNADRRAEATPRKVRVSQVAADRWGILRDSIYSAGKGQWETDQPLANVTSDQAPSILRQYLAPSSSSGGINSSSSSSSSSSNGNGGGAFL